MRTPPGLVARSADNVELVPSHTRAELMTDIAAMIKRHPDRKILVGGGWDNDLFGKTGPHKSDLDRIESARPVVLYDSWGPTPKHWKSPVLIAITPM
jgi:predicted amidohydrolase YtcJ